MASTLHRTLVRLDYILSFYRSEDLEELFRGDKRAKATNGIKITCKKYNENFRIFNCRLAIIQKAKVGNFRIKYCSMDKVLIKKI